MKKMFSEKVGARWTLPKYKRSSCYELCQLEANAFANAAPLSTTGRPLNINSFHTFQMPKRWCVSVGRLQYSRLDHGSLAAICAAICINKYKHRKVSGLNMLHMISGSSDSSPARMSCSKLAGCFALEEN